jgi:hypothetical protein
MEIMLAFLDEGTWLRDVGVPIVITVVAAILATLILRVVVHRFQRKLEQAPHLSEAGNLQRGDPRACALRHVRRGRVGGRGDADLNYLDVPSPVHRERRDRGVASGSAHRAS